MSKKLQRRHQVVLTVTFNKPVPKGWAVHAVRDCIHGEFYPSDFGGEYADQFKVRGIQLPRPSSQPRNAK